MVDCSNILRKNISIIRNIGIFWSLIRNNTVSNLNLSLGIIGLKNTSVKYFKLFNAKLMIYFKIK